MIKKIIIISLLILVCLPLAAQSSDSGMGSTYFDMSEFPQWSRDLRRGEIVALGSFPFAYFFTTFFYDTYLCANNGWDTRYAPWPAKSAGAVEYTQSQHIATLGIAAGVAITIALVDYFIVKSKRNKQLDAGNNPEGSPIINRRPLNETNEAAEDASDAASVTP